MTIFSPESLSLRTSERTNLFNICHLFFSSSFLTFISYSNFLLDESILQCVFFRYFGQDSPESPISYTTKARSHFSSLSYHLQYLYGLLCKYLILSGLTLVNIQHILSSGGEYILNDEEQHSLTIRKCRKCACPLIGCTPKTKQSIMAIETNAIRGPLNSVLNSARPTVCIKPLNECFDEWQLPDNTNRKMSAKLQCKTSPKQLTCKRVVRKYANMKKSPSTEFKQKQFLYSDSPRQPSSPQPLEPSPALPANSADNGPNLTLKEKLLNGQNSENGSSEMLGNECDANSTIPKKTAESICTPNGESLQVACDLVRRKYLKYWRKSLECTTVAGGERRFLKNVRLCDVFKPGSDKCLHARLPQNVIIPSHSSKQKTDVLASGHLENVPCSSQRTRKLSRWNAEDKNIFALLNHTDNLTSVDEAPVKNEIKFNKDVCFKTHSGVESTNKHLNQQTSESVKEQLSSDPIIVKSTESHNNQKPSSSSSNSRSHANSLNCLKKSSSHYCCVEISDPSLEHLKHSHDSCKSTLENGPLEKPCEKTSHQTCFSEDSAFSSGSSSSGIDSQEHVTKLPKVQRIRRKNGRQAPYTYNYFTNSEQEGPRIRRRRMCPCCMSSSPIKKRRRQSRSCAYDLPGDYQRFVQSTLQLHSLRNKLHLFLKVLFPKLYPFLESISADSETIDLILNEAVFLLQNDDNLITSSTGPKSQHLSSSSSSSAAINDNNKNETNIVNNNDSNKTNSRCTMENDKVIHSGPTLLNLKINVCRSPDQCLSRLTEKALTLISSLLPDLTFKEEHFHDPRSSPIEYLIDLVVRSNQTSSVPLSEVNL